MEEKIDNLPQGWAVSILDDVAQWGSGGTPSRRSPHFYGGSIPWIKTGELGSKYIRSAEELITEDALLKSSAKLFPAGSVGIAMYGATIGKLSIWAIDASTNQACAVAQPYADVISNEFLYYYLLSEKRGLIQAGKGGAQPNISQGILKDWPISLPPLNEQHRIVAKIEELFSELDKGIESLKTAREQLKVYRQAVLKHAFEGKLTEQWREDNKDEIETVEQLLARVSAPDQPRGGRKATTGLIEGVGALAVNTPKKTPPTGWKWVPLLRVARQETGHTPSRKHPEYWGGDQYWIGIVDARLHHGKAIRDTIQKPTKKGIDNSSARILPAGTVCLSRTASVGYVCIMAKPMATSQDFATWTCTEALEPKFLMYAFLAEGQELRRFGEGTTHTTIYFPEIRALHICLPPVYEQRAIVEALESNLEQLVKLNSEIEHGLQKIDVLRQSILKAAFSGQLVEQDPNDEPVPVLLERIRAEKAAQANNKKNNKRRDAA